MKFSIVALLVALLIFTGVVYTTITTPDTETESIRDTLPVESLVVPDQRLEDSFNALIIDGVLVYQPGSPWNDTNTYEDMCDLLRTEPAWHWSREAGYVITCHDEVDGFSLQITNQVEFYCVAGAVGSDDLVITEESVQTTIQNGITCMVN